MTRDEMLARMTAAELKGWQVYDAVFGLGDNLELIGMLCALIARTMGGSKTATPSDFVPYFAGSPAAEFDAEALREKLVGAARVHNARVGNG